MAPEPAKPLQITRCTLTFARHTIFRGPELVHCRRQLTEIHSGPQAPGRVWLGYVLCSLFCTAPQPFRTASCAAPHLSAPYICRAPPAFCNTCCFVCLVVSLLRREPSRGLGAPRGRTPFGHPFCIIFWTSFFDGLLMDFGSMFDALIVKMQVIPKGRPTFS